MLWGFFGNLIFAIIARMLCGNHLNNKRLIKNWPIFSRCTFPWCWSFTTILLICDFWKQNTHRNRSKISVNHTCYRQIGSKSTNHSPLAWCVEGLKVTLVAVIGGFLSDLTITCKTEILETFLRVFCFPKSRISENGGNMKWPAWIRKGWNFPLFIVIDVNDYDIERKKIGMVWIF